VASNGRTENGDGWREMVGRRMGMGSVKWQEADGDGWRQMIRRRMGTGKETAMA